MEKGATTITVAVQLGSDGFAVARNVAEHLGFRYYDWEITSQAADEAGVLYRPVLRGAERHRDRLGDHQAGG